jgi:hypothetical protein
MTRIGIRSKETVGTTGVDRDTAMGSAAAMTSEIIFHALLRSGIPEVFLSELGASDTIPPDNTAIRAENNHNNRGKT